MFKKIIFLFVLSAAIWSCGNDAATSDATASAESGLMTFGETITAADAISLGDLTTKFAEKDTVFTKLAGKVESVCKKKGCWMNLTDDTGNEIFVKFKDYGFFMPLDCEGQELVMNGFAVKSVTSVDELRHYAEDEGKSEEEIAAITEPKEEITFMADGVIFVE